MSRLRNALVLVAALFVTSTGAAPAPPIQFVFTSDAHYGITRAAFRGRTNVDARTVNHALVAAIDSLRTVTLPKDGGLDAGQPLGPIDFVTEGGDIANREETTGAAHIQSASESWAEFRADYLDGITLTTRTGGRSPVFVVPGNHDVSNAIGFYKTMTPATDPASFVAIFNLMMRPPAPKTPATFDYRTDRVLTSRDIGGLHVVFLNVWADAAGRAWLDRDLARVSPSTPVVIFTHDQPDAESRHFTNPNGAHDINATDKFENLLSDTFADGRTTTVPDVIEQRALETFLARHPNITAYFHGHSNFNQFYDWTGPDHTIVLHTFRVDSPMKGAISSKDETKLSFQVATFDPVSRTMTVRECLWNRDPAGPAHPVDWGGSVTVALAPRPPAGEPAR